MPGTKSPKAIGIKYAVLVGFVKYKWILLVTKIEWQQESYSPAPSSSQDAIQCQIGKKQNIQIVKNGSKMRQLKKKYI